MACTPLRSLTQQHAALCGQLMLQTSWNLPADLQVLPVQFDQLQQHAQAALLEAYSLPVAHAGHPEIVVNVIVLALVMVSGHRALPVLLCLVMVLPVLLRCAAAHALAQKYVAPLPLGHDVCAQLCNFVQTHAQLRLAMRLPSCCCAQLQADCAGLAVVELARSRQASSARLCLCMLCMHRSAGPAEALQQQSCLPQLVHPRLAPARVDQCHPGPAT